MRRRDETVSRRRDSYHVLEEGQERSNGKGYSDSDLALIAAQIRLEKGIGEAKHSQSERIRLEKRLGENSDLAPTLDDLPNVRQEAPPKTYYVTRQSLFGPSVVLYKVQRIDGAVLTYTVNPED